MPRLNTAEDAARLLLQAQERLGGRVRFMQAEPQRWYAVFKDGRGYQIEWSEAWGRLVLIALLGYPPTDDERKALNLALSYNALWRQVGNLRMAREGEGGELMLIGELGPEESEQDVFHASLLHFDGLRRWWADALTGEDDDVLVSPAALPPWIGRA